jgi:hypothetical protein
VEVSRLIDVSIFVKNERFMVGHEELVRVGYSLFYVYVKVWTWGDGWQCC